MSITVTVNGEGSTSSAGSSGRKREYRGDNVDRNDRPRLRFYRRDEHLTKLWSCFGAAERFVSHSTWKRDGYVRTLLDAGGWLTNAAIRERMADDLTSIQDL